MTDQEDISVVEPRPAQPEALVERRHGSREEMRCQILGVNFFTGIAQEAVDKMRDGGLLVVPAAPALIEIGTNAAYREALLSADLVIPDSGYMVLIWNLIGKPRIPRLSGLEYLRVLLMQSDARAFGNTFWIMAGEHSAAVNLKWLREQGIGVRAESVYNAPMYGKGRLEDPVLLALIEEQKPQHIIVTIGGGNQERIGLYLRRALSYKPAIHCIGAAIAFLSGDQVHVPRWADKFAMGWLLRILSHPKRYAPRYWHARKLLGILLRYRSQLPPFTGGK